MKELFKKKITKGIVAGAIALSALIFMAVPFVQASQPRDFDSNAILYGGAYSITELNNKINHGTGKPYQSSKQLKNLYNTFGIEQSDFNELKNGTVYKDGRVVVDGKVVYRDAHSVGRSYMPGSTRDNRFSYPIYWRSTRVSFASNSIPAYVLVNYDGTMAYAIIKSCGNAVKGVGEKTQPRHSITIKKFEDVNGNKTKQASEPFLSGWTFRVTGNGINKKVTTAKDGNVTVKNLKNGTYTIKEVQKSNWNSTTGLTRKVKVHNSNMVILFGNRKKVTPPREKFIIEAVKYEDVDGDATKDESEALLPDWSIRVTGNGITQEYLTNGEGLVIFRELPAGTYQVSEQQKAGWRNVTPLVQTVTVNKDNPLGSVLFGNQRIPGEEIIVPASTSLPVSGPIDMILGSFATIGLGSAGIMYRKSRKRLSDSFLKF